MFFRASFEPPSLTSLPSVHSFLFLVIELCTSAVSNRLSVLGVLCGSRYNHPNAVCIRIAHRPEPDSLWLRAIPGSRVCRNSRTHPGCSVGPGLPDSPQKDTPVVPPFLLRNGSLRFLSARRNRGT